MREPFKKPTGQQLTEIAIIFNDGNKDKKQLSKMIGMALLIVDRLYDHGDISIPSHKEQLNDKRN